MFCPSPSPLPLLFGARPLNVKVFHTKCPYKSGVLRPSCPHSGGPFVWTRTSSRVRDVDPLPSQAYESVHRPKVRAEKGRAGRTLGRSTNDIRSFVLRTTSPHVTPRPPTSPVNLGIQTLVTWIWRQIPKLCRTWGLERGLMFPDEVHRWNRLWII